MDLSEARSLLAEVKRLRLEDAIVASESLCQFLLCVCLSNPDISTKFQLNVEELLGDILVDLKKYSQANSHYTVCIELVTIFQEASDEDKVRLRFKSAKCLDHQNLIQEAIMRLNEIDSYPNLKSAAICLFHGDLLLRRFGNTSSAIQQYKLALQKDPYTACYVLPLIISNSDPATSPPNDINLRQPTLNDFLTDFSHALHSLKRRTPGTGELFTSLRLSTSKSPLSAVFPLLSSLEIESYAVCDNNYSYSTKIQFPSFEKCLVSLSDDSTVFLSFSFAFAKQFENLIRLSQECLSEYEPKYATQSLIQIRSQLINAKHVSNLLLPIAMLEGHVRKDNESMLQLADKAILIYPLNELAHFTRGMALLLSWRQLRDLTKLESAVGSFMDAISHSEVKRPFLPIFYEYVVESLLEPVIKPTDGTISTRKLPDAHEAFNYLKSFISSYPSDIRDHVSLLWTFVRMGQILMKSKNAVDKCKIMFKKSVTISSYACSAGLSVGQEGWIMQACRGILNFTLSQEEVQQVHELLLDVLNCANDAELMVDLLEITSKLNDVADNGTQSQSNLHAGIILSSSVNNLTRMAQLDIDFDALCAKYSQISAMSPIQSTPNNSMDLSQQIQTESSDDVAIQTASSSARRQRRRRETNS